MYNHMYLLPETTRYLAASSFFLCNIAILYEMTEVGPYCCAYLAVFSGHAVPVVQVCEWLGRSPGFQVPGHADRSSHLGSIEGVPGPDVVLRASLLPLVDRGQRVVSAFVLTTFRGSSASSGTTDLRD